MGDEIVALTNFLVAKGFADDQNYPVRRALSSTVTQIHFDKALPMAVILKDKRYEDLYAEQRMARSYNFRMLDGALVLMTYEFDSDRLAQSRLAFLPSPDLTEFQNDPDLYMEDVLFAEVVDRRVVTVPIRFDFEDRADVAADVVHPCAHVTLGQYKNCRIATTAPLTPRVFVGSILRSFYNTAINQISGSAPCAAHRFGATITSNEAELPHVAIP